MFLSSFIIRDFGDLYILSPESLPDIRFISIFISDVLAMQLEST